jgi:hypothetical protein
MSYGYLVMGYLYDGLVGMFTILCGERTGRYRLPISNLIYFANLYSRGINVLVCYGVSCTGMIRCLVYRYVRDM